MRLLCPILLAVSLAPLSVAAQTPHADGPTLSVEARAQDLYVSGRDRFWSKDFGGALEDFRHSLDLTDSPNTRMYLGRALRRLGRLPEAFATLERASNDAERRAVAEPRYAPTRESARAEANEIRSEIALLTVRLATLPPDATIRVGGAEFPVTAIGYPLPFVAGEVIVEFDAPGYASAREILILAPGGDALVELTPRAETASPPASLQRTPIESSRALMTPGMTLRGVDPPRARPWATTRVVGVTSLSAGAAAVITGVVFGSLAWTEHETLSVQRLPDQTLRIQGELHRDIANVLIGTGSVIAVGALVLLWLGGRSAADDRRPPLQVDIGINLGMPSLGLSGAL